MTHNTGEGRYSPAVNHRRRKALEDRPKRCSICRKLGHNKRGCPDQYGQDWRRKHTDGRDRAAR